MIRALVWWLIVTFTIAACGDDLEPTPDAAGFDCCQLAPDAEAVRACAAPSFPVDTCGVFVCRVDGAFFKVDVCGPRTTP